MAGWTLQNGLQRHGRSWNPGGQVESQAPSTMKMKRLGELVVRDARDV
jgi:hypothetical protein